MSGLEGKMIEAGRNTEPAVDAGVVFCRHVWNSVWFQKGDQLIAPDIEKEVSKVPALLDLDRVGDNRLKSKNALVELASFVEVKCRVTNVGNSSVSHVLILVFGFLMTVGIRPL
jgi:hypothetical protein